VAIPEATYVGVYKTIGEDAKTSCSSTQSSRKFEFWVQHVDNGLTIVGHEAGESCVQFWRRSSELPQIWSIQLLIELPDALRMPTK